MAVVAPHKHPFDWYLIPEIKGQPVSFVEKTPHGWSCRLCAVDTSQITNTFTTAEEHCHTWTHLQNNRKLDKRRQELEALVRQREEEIWQDLQRQQQQQQQQQSAVPKQQSQPTQNQSSEKILPVKLEKRPRGMNPNHSTVAATATATAPLDELTGAADEAYLRNSTSSRAASIRDRLLSDKKEDERLFEQRSSISSDHETSQERIRRLRAQRLQQGASTSSLDPSSGSASGAGSFESTRKTAIQRRLEEKQREKEAKRLANLELTRRHQEKLRIDAALEHERLGKRTSFLDCSDTCTIPMTTTFTQALRDARYFCGLEGTLGKE